MPKETSKKQVKEKKHFMKDFKAELKRVIWPTPKQLFNNTVAVITIVLITAIIVFALDFTFEKMNEYGIEKLKDVVDSQNTVVENAQSNSESSSNSEVANSETSANEQNTQASSKNAVNE